MLNTVSSLTLSVRSVNYRRISNTSASKEANFVPLFIAVFTSFHAANVLAHFILAFRSFVFIYTPNGSLTLPQFFIQFSFSSCLLRMTTTFALTPPPPPLCLTCAFMTMSCNTGNVIFFKLQPILFELEGFQSKPNYCHSGTQACTQSKNPLAYSY